MNYQKMCLAQPTCPQLHFSVVKNVGNLSECSLLLLFGASSHGGFSPIRILAWVFVSGRRDIDNVKSTCLYYRTTKLFTN